MTLLAVGAARRRSEPAIADTTPYAMPTARPYNVPVPAIIPTSDGTGSTVHPTVLDFHGVTPSGKWRGWRFWMVHTPYYNSNARLENPEVVVSNDGFTWVLPSGISNPIYPAPSATTDWNFDPDMVYDPDEDRIVLMFDSGGPTDGHHRWLTTSTDGITWPPLTHLIYQEHPDGVTLVGGVVCLIRRGPNDWWMFGTAGGGYTNMTLASWRASAPEGPWTGPTVVTGTPPQPLWHFDILWDDPAQEFRGIVEHGPTYLYPQHDGYRAIRGDGLTAFEWAPDRFMEPAPAETVLDVDMYRPTFLPHEDGIHYRVWYSGQSSTLSWRVCYTQVPRSEWEW